MDFAFKRVAQGTAHEIVMKELKEIADSALGNNTLDFIGFSERHTILNDLGMDSIRLVHFVELVTTHYPDVDFISWVSNRPLRWYTHLRVGDVALFIEKNHAL